MPPHSNASHEGIAQSCASVLKINRLSYIGQRDHDFGKNHNIFLGPELEPGRRSRHILVGAGAGAGAARTLLPGAGAGAVQNFHGSASLRVSYNLPNDFLYVVTVSSSYLLPLSRKYC